MILRTYSDGGARGNPGPAAVGAVLCNEKGDVVQESSHSIGETTNNQAEYQAMLLALQMAYERKARKLLCHADSELLIFQLQGRYRIKDVHLKQLAEKVKSWVSRFDSVTFKQVPREHPMIARADRLLNQTLNRMKAKGVSRPDKHEGDFHQGELF